ncbi:hypothetical protein OkiPb01555_25820 [Bordetella pertussis]|uniref:hypothetical protein n=1 Tax=Bordetella pertussis TaxID=520 RepID=UPI0003D3F369|nr:hypothetical protein [Bordetella pertussis]ETH51762.1 hypothetical protein L550_1618 [Bordetella pertussis H973]CFN66491.1 Uncharacterised protein [Bordetella pertussis]CFO09451.1 Uncharacterised protein [Bordetella pertussis]CFO29350.1 Uncharacterised protein [Bordetella pertussis]CFO74903.1 Uncharacterised protein [Bordetella pertussis]
MGAWDSVMSVTLPYLSLVSSACAGEYNTVDITMAQAARARLLGTSSMFGSFRFGRFAEIQPVIGT